MGTYRCELPILYLVDPANLTYLLQALTESSPAQNQNDRPKAHLLTPNRPELPLCLQPLTPPPLPPSEKTPRARTYHPPNEGQRKARIAWNKERALVKPPLSLPSEGPNTSWEGLGVVESLRILAGFHETMTLQPRKRVSERIEGDVQEDRRITIRHQDLETFKHLPERLGAFFPIKLVPTLREEPYPIPPPQHRRQTPGRWTRPRPLNERLIRRMYQRLFTGLQWVIPKGLSVTDAGKTSGGWRDVEWKSCSYKEMKAWESGEDATKHRNGVPGVHHSRWTVASREEIEMVRETAADTA
jgi:hypothetical protein